MIPHLYLTWLKSSRTGTQSRPSTPSPFHSSPLFPPHPFSLPSSTPPQSQQWTHMLDTVSLICKNNVLYGTRHQSRAEQTTTNQSHAVDKAAVSALSPLPVRHLSTGSDCHLFLLSPSHSGQQGSKIVPSRTHRTPPIYSYLTLKLIVLTANLLIYSCSFLRTRYLRDNSFLCVNRMALERRPRTLPKGL